MFCQSVFQIHNGPLAVWLFYIQSGYQRHHYGNYFLSTHHPWANKGVCQCESLQTFYTRFQIRINTFGIIQIYHPVLVSYIEGILPKGPYRHAVGPFWQDTLDIYGTRTQSSTSMILPSPTDYPVPMVPLICSYFMLCSRPIDTLQSMNNAHESLNDFFGCGWAPTPLSCILFCISYVENDVVGAAPTGDAPTTSEWSTFLLHTVVRLILEVSRYIQPIHLAYFSLLI